ncbi:hypothetical protein ABPG77_003288 [Micractinium sp. CCAP 211/92]
MTRDQVERLLEQTMMGLEKRLAQGQAAAAAPTVGLTAVAVNGGTPAQQAQQDQPTQQELQAQPQRKAVKTLKPLAEGQPYLDGVAATTPAAAGDDASPAAAPAVGGSGHGPGGSAHGGAGGMPRIRSLSQMQEHMSRAYHGNGSSGSESHEGTRHSHVSWADEAGKA